MLTTVLRVVLLFEVVNAAYLAAFDSASIFYHVQVVAHVVAGLLLILLLLPRFRHEIRRRFDGSRTGGARMLLGVTVVAMLIAIATALPLAVTGTATPYRAVLNTHIVASVAALIGAVAWSATRGTRRRARRAAVALIVIASFPLAVRGYRLIDPPHVANIRNPELPPLAASEEGGGEGSAFFPSSVRTVGDRLVPSDFFLESQACGNKNCHPDITAQWDSSMHHFSSFNNQWYRKSIEYMQEVVGTTPSKWCGGCHDQAVLLTGRMDVPIVEQIDTPQAQAGIGCLVCHSIVHVPDTMGQGGYVLEYPEMHRLVASDNPALEKLHDYMIRLDPGPHRKTMLKPFHRQSRSEFCSACHKVHLDVPVNSYRWLRGFNEYDAWQTSGVSGQGARSFYYPEEPQECNDCHMPLVPSRDQGNIDGYVHSHRFPAANTAVPFANQDEEQLEATREFLQSGILTVDIFAATEIGDEADRPLEGRPDAAGAGKENVPGAAQEMEEMVAASLMPDSVHAGIPPAGRAGIAGPPSPPPVAPLDRAAPFLQAGRTYRIDVVARTRRIGHFFPGGTVDAFDVWLELKAEDAAGEVLFWSGFVEDDRRGPVEKGAHRYGSLMVDAQGNPINKRNAWAARAVVYARLIPPGAADVGRFRVTIPAGTRGPVTLTARMNYRKFSWWNTQFSYAGVRDPEAGPPDVSPHHDDGSFVFTGDTSTVSGKLKEIPDLPITVIAENRVTLPLADRGAPAAPPEPQPFDRERFNDYGIGMFRQGDFSASTAAFRTVTELAPEYADGFVNVARVLVQEGNHDAAMPMLEQALEIDPDLASAHYFLALALKARGRYDEALGHLRSAAARYPRDVEVRNQIGRLLFLARRHTEAIEEFRTALRVNPEDLTAHYNMMLAYRALGDEENERIHESLYVRFKADEASQAITGPYRRENPEDNLERQPIHEHENRYRPRIAVQEAGSTAAAGGAP